MKPIRGVCPLLSIFVLAVLVPSIALGILALRAAERESMYVERRLEGTLLAEVDLAARRVEELTNEIFAELQANSSHTNPLVDVPFTLQGDRIDLQGSGPARERFMIAFGAFLQEGARLPVYDSIARVYRKGMGTLDAETTTASSLSSYAKRQDASPPAAYGRSAPEPMAAAPGFEAADVSESSVPEAQDAQTEQKVQKIAPVTGAARQLSKRRIATDSAVREEAFNQASMEGFEISKRNVAPQGQGILAQAPADERSETVSRGRTFAELQGEWDGGLLPRLSDSGLEVLFWTRRQDGEIVGCNVRMSVLRERIADVIPDVYSEIRTLTVLDEEGAPVVAPDIPEQIRTPDWRRPFVAREISPILPRWEVGAWLTDPAILTNRAHFAQLAVWVLVATLFLVIAIGGAVVLRILSSEMRTAAQKTTFVANVSHELKTPLTSIRLFAELLLSGKQPDEERRREYLRTMVSETERLTNLVDNVLVFSKRGNGKEKYSMQPLSLSELARNTVEQLRPHLAKNGFSVELADEDGPLPVSGEPETLRQVIMNLLSNAEKYSGEGREILVTCGPKDGFAVVEVADRGIGVDPKFAEKIFREFFRCDDSLAAPKNGAGLGLAIARDIARRHGGDVTYAPREGGGSVFALRMPLKGETS